MHAESLLHTITQALSEASDSWKTGHSCFLHEEHIRAFAAKMAFYQTNGVPEHQPPPHFEEEVTAPLRESFAFFADALTRNTVEDWRNAFETTPFKHVLLLMGQRLTSASVQNAGAVPPLRDVLLQSCFCPYNEHTSVAARAWEKHVGRSAEGFFGEVKGNPPEKERTVHSIIRNMFENQTWWNLFYHYKHGNVYEIRVPSGHGMRWSGDGETFIGFLEPFL